MKAPIEVNELNFRTDVLNARLPVLVEFWAEWCELCQTLSPLLEEIGKRFEGRIKIARVDVAKNRELSGLCFIETLPTMLYFADGLVRDRIVGIETKEAIVSRLEQLLVTSWGKPFPQTSAGFGNMSGQAHR
jgi:thioredoxin 1